MISAEAVQSPPATLPDVLRPGSGAVIRGVSFPQPKPPQPLWQVFRGLGITPEAAQVREAYIRRSPEATKAQRGAVAVLVEVARAGVHRTMAWVAEEAGISSETVHKAAHRLAEQGSLSLTGGDRYWVAGPDGKSSARRRCLGYQLAWSQDVEPHRGDMFLFEAITEARAAGVPEETVQRLAKKRSRKGNEELRTQASLCRARGANTESRSRPGTLAEIKTASGANETNPGLENLRNNKYLPPQPPKWGDRRAVGKSRTTGTPRRRDSLTLPYDQADALRAEDLLSEPTLRCESPRSTARRICVHRAGEVAKVAGLRVLTLERVVAEVREELRGGLRSDAPAGLVVHRYRVAIDTHLDGASETSAQRRPQFNEAAEDSQAPPGSSPPSPAEIMHPDCGTYHGYGPCPLGFGELVRP